MAWLDLLYNLILLGPNGVGKTHLAIGIGIKAIEEGDKVAFISMEELIHVLKTEELTRKSKLRLKRIREAHLLFHLINELYNQSSILLTSNKSPGDWGELLGNPALTAAMLDRLIHTV